MPVAEDTHEAYATYYTHVDEKASRRWPAHLERLALYVVHGLKKLWLKPFF